MKVLVTGATGFIGRAVCEELLARHHEIRITSRGKPTKAGRVTRADAAELVRWDPSEGPIPEAALQDIEAVLHLAGEPVAAGRWTPEQKMKIRDSRVLGTRHFWQRLTKMRATGKGLALKTVVASSAIGFYGDRGDEILNESARAGEGFLADVCRQWESEIFRPGFDEIRQVAVRTGVVLGMGGGALAKQLPIFKLGAGGPLGSGRQWVSWIHLDDIARIFVDALEQEAYRGVIHGVAPGAVTNQEFGQTLGRVLGRPAVLPVPAVALKFALGEMAQMILASQRVTPAAALRLGFEFRFPNLESALRDLLNPRSKS